MRYSLALACAMLATPLAAENVRVVTDFPVTHSLVSKIMGEVGTPALLMDRGGDPHSFQLRPSQARDLAEADLIFWVGEELTPWLARALAGVEAQGEVVTLLQVDGIQRQDFRHGHAHDHDDDHGHGSSETADDHGHSDESHGHAHDDHGHDHETHADHGDSHDSHDHAQEGHGHAHDTHDHAHDDHGHAHDTHDHAHDDHGHAHDTHGHAHDDHGHEHDTHGHAHDDHGHTGLDPHAWMNPGNVQIWLDVIAAELAEHDPENAEIFMANAASARDDVDALRSEIEEILAPVSSVPFVVFHDAYGYLAEEFGLNIAGTIALGDAAAPGAQRLSELRAHLQDDAAVCIFPEVNHSSRYVDVVVEGTDVRVGAELDPEGVTLEPGPALYTMLMRGMAEAIAECLAG